MDRADLKRKRQAEAEAPTTMPEPSESDEEDCLEATALWRMWEAVGHLEPLRLDPCVVKDTKRSATKVPSTAANQGGTAECKSSIVSSNSSDSTESKEKMTEARLVFDIFIAHGSGFCDFKTLMRCCLTSKTMFNDTMHGIRERRMCKYFLLTRDTKVAAGHAVIGGWDAFINFLMRVAHLIQSSFAKLGMHTPPKLYRALMAQQAIRSLDDSPHPLLFESYWEEIGGYEDRQDPPKPKWRYQSVDAFPWRGDRSSHEATATGGGGGSAVEESPPPPQSLYRPRKPTLALCFAYSNEDGDGDDGSGCDVPSHASSEGYLVLPHDGMSGGDIKSCRTNLHDRNLAVEAHVPGDSFYRHLVEKGEYRFLFVAYRKYTSAGIFWVLALDSDDAVSCDVACSCCGSCDPAFGGDVLDSNLSKLIVSSEDEDGGDGDVWGLEHTNPAALLAWSCMAKSLKIEPFASTFDFDKAKRKLKMAFDNNWIRGDIADANEQDKAIWEYYRNMELLYDD